ncbi:hypothetical protein SAMN06297144_2165 [Sphingomonas guangdongensis]|uniref:Uncharacterized protein n=1 Tax=Sphingomonas guangdongensis TaxID=1141890 RepID=A0A285QYJ7_9SPHN|nr:hypothetical protein [Sphingomonas guangdongensis]SOB87045.1 hypothetical protein SAMN06297144_2165 [Sphingomonas guangdongensis]
MERWRFLADGGGALHVGPMRLFKDQWRLIIALVGMIAAREIWGDWTHNQRGLVWLGVFAAELLACVLIGIVMVEVLNRIWPAADGGADRGGDL